MRIVDVQVPMMAIPAQPPFRWRAGLPGSEPAGTGAMLRISTDEGIMGLAVTGRGRIVADLVERRLRAEVHGGGVVH